MGGAVIDHDIRRSIGDEVVTDASGFEEMPAVKYVKAPIDINPRVNLFALYEKRRKDFLARRIPAATIVKMLQFEYWTGLSDKDAKNLYGWAKEDSMRVRGVEPYPVQKTLLQKRAAT